MILSTQNCLKYKADGCVMILSEMAMRPQVMISS